MAQRILGLDVGATTVRAVVLEGAYRGWLVRAAVKGPVAPEAEGGPPLRDRQVEAVRALLAEHHLAPDAAVVALPGISAAHVVTLPFTDPRRIEQTIAFEVEGLIPFDLAEVCWDWQPLRTRDGQSDLLVAVARREELAGLLAGLAVAGVDPRAVVPPGPAYAALLAEGAVAGGAAPGEDAVEVVLDLDAGRASLAVCRGGACEAARTFAAAPDVASLLRELRASLRAWRARAGAQAPPVRRALLAGEAAALPGLAEALHAELEAPVEPLPLAGPAADGISAEEAPAMALALALALRGYEGGRAPRLNLRRGDLAYTRDFEHLRARLERLGAWAALVLLLAMVSSGVKLFALSRQEQALDRALCDATQALVGKCFENDELAVAALRGRGTAAASIPRSSATDILAELSQRAPPDVSMRLDRIEITRDKLHLQGVTEAAESVDRIVAGLRGSRCFGDARSGGARRRSSDGKFEFTIDSAITCDAAEAPGGRT